MKKFAITVLVFFSLIFTGSAVFSARFDPNQIITNKEMFDYRSMSLRDIYAFLASKNPSLINTFLPDYNGFRRSIPFIIHQAAYENEINPKVLITILQKEQSLIEDKTPSQKQFDWASGYGVCDSCGMDDPDLQEFKGLGRQVDLSARILKKYTLNQLDYTFQVNKRSLVDNYIVTPRNVATANLYNYTPHVSGNQSFYTIWNKYWNDNNTTLARAEVKGESFNSFNDDFIKKLKFELERRIEESQIVIPEFSVVVVRETGNYYIFVNNQMRSILLRSNLKADLEISQKTLQTYSLGDDVEESDLLLSGLVHDVYNEVLYFIEDGIKYPIFSREILLSRFGQKSIQTIKNNALQIYKNGSPVLFLDDTFVTTEERSQIYVMKKGYLRPLKDSSILDDKGISINDVIITTKKAIDIHPIGEFID